MFIYGFFDWIRCFQRLIVTLTGDISVVELLWLRPIEPKESLSTSTKLQCQDHQHPAFGLKPEAAARNDQMEQSPNER